MQERRRKGDLPAEEGGPGYWAATLREAKLDGGTQPQIWGGGYGILVWGTHLERW